MRAGRRRPRDSGAAAVEFALVTPLLFLVLFGIIQYGYGFFQLQAAQATAREAAIRAAKGIDSCNTFGTVVRQIATDNGMQLDGSTNAADGVRLEWSRDPGKSGPGSGRTEIGDSVKVTLEYTPALDLPLIPYPDTITRTARTRVETLGDLTILDCA